MDENLEDIEQEFIEEEEFFRRSFSGIKSYEKKMIFLSIFIVIIVSILGGFWNLSGLIGRFILVLATVPIGGGLLVILIINFIRWRNLKRTYRN